MAIFQSNLELCTGQRLNYSSFNDKFVVIFWHTHLRTVATYSNVLTWRRLRRRIAFFSSIRRCSLLETNQRLQRTVLKTRFLQPFCGSASAVLLEIHWGVKLQLSYLSPPFHEGMILIFRNKDKKNRPVH